MWHPANGHFNHIKACYNLVCRTISFGAGDLERTLRAKVRIRLCLEIELLRAMGAHEMIVLRTALKRTQKPHT